MPWSLWYSLKHSCHDWKTFQNRALRRILRQPAHIEHTTNVEVRTQAKVHSIQSTVLLRRLTWWQSVLKNEEAAGVRLAIFGTLPWDSELPTSATSSRVKLLSDDLCILNGHLPAHLQWKGLQEIDLHPQHLAWESLTLNLRLF